MPRKASEVASGPLIQFLAMWMVPIMSAWALHSSGPTVIKLFGVAIFASQFLDKLRMTQASLATVTFLTITASFVSIYPIFHGAISGLHGVDSATMAYIIFLLASQVLSGIAIVLHSRIVTEYPVWGSAIESSLLPFLPLTGLAAVILCSHSLLPPFAVPFVAGAACAIAAISLAVPPTVRYAQEESIKLIGMVLARLILIFSPVIVVALNSRFTYMEPASCLLVMVVVVLLTVIFCLFSEKACVVVGREEPLQIPSASEKTSRRFVYPVLSMLLFLGFMIGIAVAARRSEIQSTGMPIFLVVSNWTAIFLFFIATVSVLAFTYFEILFYGSHSASSRLTATIRGKTAEPHVGSVSDDALSDYDEPEGVPGIAAANPLFSKRQVSHILLPLCCSALAMGCVGIAFSSTIPFVGVGLFLTFIDAVFGSGVLTPALLLVLAEVTFILHQPYMRTNYIFFISAILPPYLVVVILFLIIAFLLAYLLVCTRTSAENDSLMGGEGSESLEDEDSEDNKRSFMTTLLRSPTFVAVLSYLPLLKSPMRWVSTQRVLGLSALVLLAGVVFVRSLRVRGRLSRAGATMMYILYGFFPIVTLVPSGTVRLAVALLLFVSSLVVELPHVTRHYRGRLGARIVTVAKHRLFVIAGVISLLVAISPLAYLLSGLIATFISPNATVQTVYWSLSRGEFAFSMRFGIIVGTFVMVYGAFVLAILAAFSRLAGKTVSGTVHRVGEDVDEIDELDDADIGIANLVSKDEISHMFIGSGSNEERLIFELAVCAILAGIFILFLIVPISSEDIDIGAPANVHSWGAPTYSTDPTGIDPHLYIDEDVFLDDGSPHNHEEGHVDEKDITHIEDNPNDDADPFDPDHPDKRTKVPFDLPPMEHVDEAFEIEEIQSKNPVPTIVWVGALLIISFPLANYMDRRSKSGDKATKGLIEEEERVTLDQLLKNPTKVTSFIKKYHAIQMAVCALIYYILVLFTPEVNNRQFGFGHILFCVIIAVSANAAPSFTVFFIGFLMLVTETSSNSSFRSLMLIASSIAVLTIVATVLTFRVREEEAERAQDKLEHEKEKKQERDEAQERTRAAEEEVEDVSASTEGENKEESEEEEEPEVVTPQQLLHRMIENQHHMSLSTSSPSGFNWDGVFLDEAEAEARLRERRRISLGLAPVATFFSFSIITQAAGMSPGAMLPLAILVLLTDFKKFHLPWNPQKTVNLTEELGVTPIRVARFCLFLALIVRNIAEIWIGYRTAVKLMDDPHNKGVHHAFRLMNIDIFFMIPQFLILVYECMQAFPGLLPPVARNLATREHKLFSVVVGLRAICGAILLMGHFSGVVLFGVQSLLTLVEIFV